MQLSVIIVSYNAANFLRKCLVSVEKNLPNDSEIIVFDNNSPNREVEKLTVEFPDVNFMLNDENVGFSRGNNLAVENAKGEMILILNPDTIVYEDFFPAILNFATKNTNFGAIGVQMRDGNGNFLPESKRNIPSIFNAFGKLFFLTKKSNSGYYNQSLLPNQTGKVDVLTGACMLMKKSVYEQVGGFDNRYFMYGEDIDLCYSLLASGYENFYLGNVVITHFKGESTVKNITYLKRFYGAIEIFINKYYRRQKPVQFALMYLGLKIKYGIELMKMRYF